MIRVASRLPLAAVALQEMILAVYDAEFLCRLVGIRLAPVNRKRGERRGRGLGGKGFGWHEWLHSWRVVRVSLSEAKYM